MSSIAVEDYLKAMWHLQERVAKDSGVPTQALAERLKVRAASVTKMVKKLALRGLVNHIPYQGVRLTQSGRRQALGILRRHRLLEAFLVESLGLGWAQAHKEAELLEHGLSPELEQTLADALGNPQRDPHGHPIPTREGKLPLSRALPLSSWPLEKVGEIEQVRDEDPTVLNWLLLNNLVPGQRLKVLSVEPGGKGLNIEVQGVQVKVNEVIAQSVFVAPPDSSPGPTLSQLLPGNRRVSLVRDTARRRGRAGG